MSSRLNNNKKYKNYVDDYGSKSNMKLVYILVGLTVLTVALVVLLILFLNGTFDGNPTPTQTPAGVVTPAPDDNLPATGEEQTGTEEEGGPATSPGEVVSGEVVSVTITTEANQIPEGGNVAFMMGSGDRAGCIVVDNGFKNKGDLILVNSKYPLDATYSLFNRVNVYNEARNNMSYPLNVDNTNIELEKRALAAVIELFKGAEAAGHTKYFIAKGYMKEDEIPDYLTGLSLDIGFTRLEGQSGKFAELPQGQWVMENAYLFGFVQRYTAEKNSITGQKNDPTDYRFVGFPHSYVMKAKNMCLEEYLDYIRSAKSITVKKNEQIAYEVSYFYADPNSVDAKTACKMSNKAIEAYNQGKAKFTVSGDNFAGFIVTTIYTP